MTCLAQIARDVRARTRARSREDNSERELSHHIAVADVLRRFARDDVLWFHPANGERRDKRTAAKLRAMGVQPGAPDFVIIVAGRVYLLEMKRPGGEKPHGAQQDFLFRAVAAGCETAVAFGVDAALDRLNLWGALRVRVSPAMIGGEAA
jgi:hypothetical protein